MSDGSQLLSEEICCQGTAERQLLKKANQFWEPHLSRLWGWLLICSLSTCSRLWAVTAIGDKHITIREVTEWQRDLPLSCSYALPSNRIITFRIRWCCKKMYLRMTPGKTDRSEYWILELPLIMEAEMPAEGVCHCILQSWEVNCNSSIVFWIQWRTGIVILLFNWYNTLLLCCPAIFWVGGPNVG